MSLIGLTVQHFGQTCILLLFATMVSPAAAAPCKFTYAEDVQRNIVIPEIERRLGIGGPRFLDLANPIIIVRGNRVELMFGAVRDDLMDPPFFDMLLLECGRKLGGARLWWWPGTGATGGWITPKEKWPSREVNRTTRTRRRPKFN